MSTRSDYKYIDGKKKKEKKKKHNKKVNNYNEIEEAVVRYFNDNIG